MFNQGKIKLSWFSLCFHSLLLENWQILSVFRRCKKIKTYCEALYCKPYICHFSKFALAASLDNLWSSFREILVKEGEKTSFNLFAFLYRLLSILWASVCKIYLSMRQKIQISVMHICKGLSERKVASPATWVAG